MNRGKMIPFTVIPSHAASDISVTTTRSVGGKHNYSATFATQLPSTSAFSAFGYPRFPTTVGLFLYPSGNGELLITIKHRLVLAIVHLDIFISVQVNCFASPGRRIGDIACRAHMSTMVIITGSIIHIIFKQPLTEKTIPAWNIKALDTRYEF